MYSVILYILETFSNWILDFLLDLKSTWNKGKHEKKKKKNLFPLLRRLNIQLRFNLKGSHVNELILTLVYDVLG
jgi:hypothetical protein